MDLFKNKGRKFNFVLYRSMNINPLILRKPIARLDSKSVPFHYKPFKERRTWRAIRYASDKTSYLTHVATTKRLQNVRQTMWWQILLQLLDLSI